MAIPVLPVIEFQHNWMHNIKIELGFCNVKLIYIIQRSMWAPHRPRGAGVRMSGDAQTYKLLKCNVDYL
jgi:hypothetical protein